MDFWLFWLKIQSFRMDQVAQFTTDIWLSLLWRRRGEVTKAAVNRYEGFFASQSEMISVM